MLFTILKAFPFILTNGTHFKRFPNNLQKYHVLQPRIQINEPIKAQTDGEFIKYGNVEFESSIGLLSIYYLQMKFKKANVLQHSPFLYLLKSFLKLNNRLSFNDFLVSNKFSHHF